MVALSVLILLVSLLVALPLYIEHRDVTDRIPLPPPFPTARPNDIVIHHTAVDSTSSSSVFPSSVDGVPSATTVRLYYELHGHCPFDPTSPSSIKPSDTYTGDTVLLLNPTGGATHLWTIETETVPALVKAGYCVIVFDHRGQGRSELASGLYTIPMFAADAAKLLEELKAPPVHVLGWSLGAGVAHALTIHFPSKVKSLILTGFLSWYEHNWLGWFFSRSWIIRLIGMKWYGKLASGAMEIEPINRTAEKFQSIMVSNDIEGYVKTSSSWERNYNLTSRLPEIQVPVVHLHGERDYAAGFTKARKEADIAKMKNGKLVEFPATSHLLPVESPDKFNSAVIKFLDEVRLPH